MGYYNPYIQPTYFGSPSATMQPVQQNPMSSNVLPVDGEVGAKAYPVPNGSTGPIALWDTNDNVIYLRTFNAAGMPNPLRKLRYTEEELLPQLPAALSDMSKYVTRDDLESLRQEIQNMRISMEGMKTGGPIVPNQNGSNSNSNSGQNRRN